MRQAYEAAEGSRKRLQAQKERLKEMSSWCPYPILLSFGLALVFIGHILPSINQRLGNPAEVLPYASPPAPEGAIWLAINHHQGQVMVTTDDRQQFRWQASTSKQEVPKDLVVHLQERIIKATLSASLAKKIAGTELLAVLAVDQSVKYLHLKPVLAALAEAGISQYAFETRQPVAGS